MLFLVLTLKRRMYSQEVQLTSEYHYRSQIAAEKDSWWAAVIDYIDETLDQPLSVKSVAQHFGYESGYFSKLFDEKFTYPLSRYISDRDVALAKVILQFLPAT